MFTSHVLGEFRKNNHVLWLSGFIQFVFRSKLRLDLMDQVDNPRWKKIVFAIIHDPF